MMLEAGCSLGMRLGVLCVYVWIELVHGLVRDD